MRGDRRHLIPPHAAHALQRRVLPLVCQPRGLCTAAFAAYCHVPRAATHGILILYFRANVPRLSPGLQCLPATSALQRISGRRPSGAASTRAPLSCIGIGAGGASGSALLGDDSGGKRHSAARSTVVWLAATDAVRDTRAAGQRRLVATDSLPVTDCHACKETFLRFLPRPLSSSPIPPLVHLTPPPPPPVAQYETRNTIGQNDACVQAPSSAAELSYFQVLLPARPLNSTASCDVQARWGAERGYINADVLSFIRSTRPYIAATGALRNQYTPTVPHSHRITTPIISHTLNLPYSTLLLYLLSAPRPIPHPRFSHWSTPVSTLTVVNNSYFRPHPTRPLFATVSRRYSKFPSIIHKLAVSSTDNYSTNTLLSHYSSLVFRLLSRY